MMRDKILPDAKHDPPPFHSSYDMCPPPPLSDLDLGVAVDEIVGGDLEVERSRALADTRRRVVV